MQVIRDALNAPDLPSGCVATIGNYDGVHRGQQAVLQRVRERATELGLQAVVVSFDPHPLAVLRPDAVPARLTTDEQKVDLLREQGVDTLAVVRFTPEFARTTARQFAVDFLHRRLGVAEVYVGSDFSFGHRREGDLAMLRELGAELGFEALQIDEVRQAGERVSSTAIREMLRRGDVSGASEALGRPYAIRGVIARGDRMGQRLGWPTINLDPDNELVPLGGVYTSQVYFPSFEQTFHSVTNIGRRPTVYENYEQVVESHILDFRSDVYGEIVELSFHRRLRDEMQFDSMMDLSAQIALDVEATREYFAAQAPDDGGLSVIDRFQF
ncbi:MAG: bifunctional riboflavin kinase/FAD synthetase [Acidobacteria bacterium]|nr:MAG: bifunctional riboflavin kinase/FAD synthetase [Acidobacteriota bacterium]REK00275.1 MAG: bifunctional riboflavin kinase/FAD synthetase [Acidobacteriota bacterium]